MKKRLEPNHGKFDSLIPFRMSKWRTPTTTVPKIQDVLKYQIDAERKSKFIWWSIFLRHQDETSETSDVLRFLTLDFESSAVLCTL